MIPFGTLLKSLSTEIRELYRRIMFILTFFSSSDQLKKSRCLLVLKRVVKKLSSNKFKHNSRQLKLTIGTIDIVRTVVTLVTVVIVVTTVASS